MSRPKQLATLIAGLATLSLLLVIVACDGDNRGSEPDARPPATAVSPSTPTPTPTPTPTASRPTPSPTPPESTPLYDVEREREKLAEARRKWGSEGSDNYSFDVSMGCLCPETSTTLRVTVRDGAIQSVHDVYSGETFTEEDLVYAYKTVYDWFRVIGSALGWADVLRVTYHPSLGYPTYLGINYDVDVIDYAFGLELFSYTPEDPDAPPRPLYDVEQAREELAAAKAKWEAEGSDDYAIDYRLRCDECPENDRLPFVKVRNGAIESVIDQATSVIDEAAGGLLTGGEALTEDDFLYGYKTIDDWFELIEDALGSRPAYMLSVEYSSIEGYPRSLTVRYEYGAADDDFSLNSFGYTPLAPSLPTATPEASSTNNPRDVSAIDLFSDRPGSDVASSIGPAYTVEEVLAKGLRLAGASPVHLALRGTAAADSIRCDWRGIARTPAQRENAIRFWLGLDADDDVPEGTYLEALFTAAISVLEPEFQETARSNFMVIVEGGLSEEYLYLTCHVDYTPSEYLLGSGPLSPNVQSVAYDRRGEAQSYDLYRKEHDAGVFGSAPLMSAGEYQAQLGNIVQEAEALLAAEVGGRENVVMLAPMGAHNAIAVEAWQAVAQWDLQTDDDNVVQAVRYGALPSDPEHTQTLANLRSRIRVATATSGGASGASGSTTPTRIANAGGLTKYYRDIGAYSDITPGDGATTTFTPAKPPETYVCTSGTAVTNPTSNLGLVHDCDALLDSKDALRGTGSLNWAAGTAIGSWNGVSTGGSPARVTKVELASKSLTGSIPSELGSLLNLTHLDLSANSLTGQIPAELGWLHNLTNLKLSGNNFTGCIPLALKSVTTNDLSTLNLLYCHPPAPGNLAAGTAEPTSIPLTWAVVSNAGKYRVEYREGKAGDWTVDDESLTTAAHTVDSLKCEQGYQFRVSAFGSGTIYAAAWSEPSAPVTASTAACVTPVFDEESYSFSLADDAAIGAAVGTVEATDPNDDTLSYSITAGNGDGKFSIGTSTGAITVAGALSYETTSLYTLTVQASDGTNSTTVTVTITVLQPNVAPVFDQESYSFPVLETAILFTVVGTVSATDANPDDVLTYRVTAGDTASWNVDANAGLVVVRRKLDADTKASYSLTVEVRDKGGLTDTAAVEITVHEEPTEPPTAPTGLAAAQAAEEGDEVKVSWDAIRGASQYLLQSRTGGASGTWTDLATTADTSHTFTAACGTAYDFRVQAQGDGIIWTKAWGSVSSVASHTSTVCPPAFGEESYNFSVAEDAAVAAAVGTAAATFGGSGALSYSITAGDASGQFSIAGSGAITVAKALDFETTPSYTLTVTAAEPGGQSGTATVSITVTDVNETPAFDPDSYSFSIAENAAVGASVGSVSATDPDEDALTYSITAGDPDSHFSIDANGAITVAKALDFETTPSYTLTVTAEDPDGLSDTATVAVTVTDANDPPAFDPDSYSFSIAEDAAVGAAVGTASATDPDEDTLTYSITAGDADSQFSIDADGDITVAKALDFETTPSYTLTVQVADPDGESDTAEVAVTVTDANDPPSFDEDEYAFTVAEDAAVGAAVGTVSATDPDEDTLTYSITAGDTDSQFSIDAGGDITVAGELDRESTESYTLTVTATDPESESGTVEVAVTVTDVNEAPAFDEDSYSFSIAEDSAVEASVGSASATDPDEDTLTYSITAGDTDGQFSIDASGAITVAKILDYETTSSYTLTVQAEDPDGLSDTATVAVTVTDANDPPVFDEDEYSFSVAEDAAVGASVGSVAATDQDEDTLTFSITAGDSSSQFSVDASGAITVAKALDHETTASYTLTVEASDGNDGSDTTEVTVAVTNVNETPSFDKTEYAFTVAEDAAVGAAVGTAPATDPDGDALTYSITAGDADGQFSIGAGGQSPSPRPWTTRPPRPTR